MGFFVYALLDAWNQTNGDLPSIPRLLVASACVAIGTLCGATAWAILLGGERRVDHAASLLVAQLGKYVPGAVWQAAGQIGLARTAGVRVRRSIVTFTVMAVTQAVAGCAYASVLAATWSSASVPGRALLAVGAVASLALLDRRWMIVVLHRIKRTRDAAGDLVPAQRPILFAWGASVVTLAANSLALVLLLGGFGAVHDPLWVMSAYAVAWTVGFVVVPVPSGVGIREGVFVAIVHGTFPSSVLVAASVYHRLVTLAVEGLLAAIASHRTRPARLRTAPADGD
jgi:uncharacterized membrane protein YbhN (UPF0104 family)